MKQVFADTSYYVALANPHDVAHERAVVVSRRRRQPVLMTEFILIELGNILSRGSDRAVFLAVLKSLRGSEFVTIVPIDSSLLERGIDLYAQRQDKSWSLTDCTSFAVMQEHGITEALTTDHHFEPAGFAVLLN